MPDNAESIPQPRIVMSFLADGTVGLELMSGSHRTLDLQVARADDRARTTQILRTWALEPPSSSLVRIDAYRQQLPEFDDAYMVVLDTRTWEQLLPFSTSALALHEGFARAFSPGETAARRGAIDKFSVDLAVQIHGFVRRARALAAARLADGAYLPVLAGYLTTLRAIRSIEQQNAWPSVNSGIGGILKDERYLLLSEDPAARSIYRELQDELQKLYRWYMDLSRGGVERAR